MLEQDFKFFDGFLTLRDRFLATFANLWIAEGMKLASEEMLIKVGEMYADLSLHHRDTMAKVALLENQKTLV